MTGYGVKIVRDGSLPPDVDWMFVKSSDGAMVLYLTTSSAGCARALAEAWAAFRAIQRPTPTIPQQPRALQAAAG